MLELRCVSSFSVDVMTVWLWFCCGCFIMNGPFIWWVFCVPPPTRMLLLCILFSTRLCVLSRQCQPFSSHATCFLHVQGDGFQRGQVFAKGERSKRCSYNTIVLSSLIWHLLVWPQTWFLTFAHCKSALICRENGLDAEEEGSKNNSNKSVTPFPRHSHWLNDW